MCQSTILACKRGTSELFLQKQTSAQNRGPMGRPIRIFAMMKPSIEAMAMPNVLTDIFPHRTLDKLHISETVEIASVEMCSLPQNPTIEKTDTHDEATKAKIVHSYLPDTMSDDVEPMENREGKPLTVEEEGALEEDKIDNCEPKPSNLKRKRRLIVMQMIKKATQNLIQR